MESIIDLSTIFSAFFCFKRNFFTFVDPKKGVGLFESNLLIFSKYKLEKCVKRKALSGSSSFGRARPCQGRGGRFEPGLPLKKSLLYGRDFFIEID